MTIHEGGVPRRPDQLRTPEKLTVTVDAVHKFGGTSMAAIDRVTNIIVDEKTRKPDKSMVVVVSAFSGVTDRLLNIWNSYVTNGQEANLTFYNLAREHVARAHAMGITGNHLEDYAKYIYDLFPSKMSQVLRPDDILSFGERASSKLLETDLRRRGIKARAVDATQFIKTDYLPYQDPEVNWEKTHASAKRVLGSMIESGTVPIVTGFIGSRLLDNRTVTLGRGGSDYTASIIGKVMDAPEVNIWTDVDGVYTGNPKTDKTATLIDEMNQEQADQMARDGHKVLYPRTIEPLLGTDTIVRVRNTFNPEHPGTKILRAA